MENDEIFKALADEHRRLLLDLLFQQDGQTLSELCAHLPMTRYGCMKHLQILEDAGLVTTKKVGREKYHYLNPVPIQLVYNRWVSKYAQPYAQTLSALKDILEDQRMELQAHVFQVFIRTTPEKLWQAVTSGDFTQQYYFGSRIDSTWESGAPYNYSHPGGLLVSGEIIECSPPLRLVTTFVPHYVPGAAEASPPSKVTWEIEPRGALCKLTVTHEAIDPANPSTPGMFEGWSLILSGLKTLLETGEALPADS